MSAYLRFADKHGFECEVVYSSESAWSVHVTGEGCWDLFRAESGKHVVQRVPVTESKGRRHTSVVAVAVLPLEKRAEVALRDAEVEIVTQCGHGKGGQNQNKVESAVRAIHKPSRISVFINGRDQFRNKRLALEILAAKVAEAKQSALNQSRSELKAEQLGFCGRSGKVRTYNFINSVVIDHRTGRKTHQIGEVMKGNFDLLR